MCDSVRVPFFSPFFALFFYWATVGAVGISAWCGVSGALLWADDPDGKKKKRDDDRTRKRSNVEMAFQKDPPGDSLSQMLRNLLACDNRIQRKLILAASTNEGESKQKHGRFVRRRRGQPPQGRRAGVALFGSRILFAKTGHALDFFCKERER